MKTNNSEYKGERLSFFKIFSQKNYKLVIPIIQRDFAQGRLNDDTNEVRNDFLDALYTYLKENRPNRDLDFIYGTLQKDKDDEHIHFIPLDGQQRLTTLFLLHWFLYQISNDQTAKQLFKSKLLCENKSLFTYETRQSSTDFCDALMRSDIDMNQLITIKDSENNDVPSLSATLKNEPWFFRFWKTDPTVQSMLVMIDAIYHKFCNHAEYFNRLIDENNPIVTFIFMDLKEYKLTDDLYIKMNSRGKPLTKFENFKAKFEQYIKKYDGQSMTRKFYLKFANQEKEVNLQQYFSYNIDTKWTTLFWQYCKDGKQGNLDSYIENFIRVIITNHYASIVKLQSKKTSDYTFDVLINKENKSLSFSKYESTEALSKESVLSIVDSFDAIYNGNNKIAHYISKEYKAYFDEEKMFKKAIENDLSLPERMQFYAYIQYLVFHKEHLTGINEWMRIIHNLTHPDNTITDGNDDFARGIKSIAKLLPNAPYIIEYLQKESSIDGFSKHQSMEECIKSHLIVKENWKQIIEDAEKHPYFNGQIGFILEFSGIYDSYINNNNDIIWTEVDNLHFLQNFIRYTKIASFIFDLDEKGERFNDKNFCLERAVLAHGDYLLEGNDGYWNLLSTETVAKNVKRDLSWRRVLRICDDNPLIQKSKNLIKQTFDNIPDINNIVDSLEKLCVPHTEQKWRNILISSPEMFRVCEKGFMYFDRSEILLLGKWFLNHYHSELFTYHLWIKKFEQAEKFPGFEKEYSWQKRSDITPHISIKDFTYKRNKYCIQIYTELNENDDFSCFELSFGYNNENKFDYPDEIIKLMNQLDFKNEDSDVNWFTWHCISEDSAYEKAKEITTSLIQLKR